MFLRGEKNSRDKQFNPLYKRSGMYLISIITLFIFIGILTTVKPAYRFSSEAITAWTSDIDSSTFLYLMGMENRAFQQAYPEDKALPKLSATLFQIATNIKPNDPRSLIGQELPGFSTFGNRIIIAGEGIDQMSLSIESSPPLEDVLKDREAISEEPSEEIQKSAQENQLDTGERNVVYIYNTHNRESFLPHLPDVTDPNMAHHGEVNITKVSDRFAEGLAANGIGSEIDSTDHMSVLNEKGWGYGRSYDASREAVAAAVSGNKDLEYIFDIHRDSLPKEKTTKVIDGKSYAKILMVIGAEYDSYEKNLLLATELQQLIDEKYPGLSKGVITKEGAGTNGVFNQDLSENALLVEFGGYDNTLEELYRTADVVAEVFSDMYWDAEKVDTNK